MKIMIYDLLKGVRCWDSHGELPGVEDMVETETDVRWDDMIRFMSRDERMQPIWSDETEQFVLGYTIQGEPNSIYAVQRKPITMHGCKKGQEHAVAVLGYTAHYFPWRARDRIVIQSIRPSKYSGKVVVTARSFAVGDMAKYDSYNLSYLGQITKISLKTVTIRAPYGRPQRRLDLYQFCWRNYKLDVAKTQAENSDAMMYL